MRIRAVGPIAVLTLAVVLVLSTGCQQSEVPHEKQARLTAAENLELQQQLAVRQAESNALKEKYAQELRQREEELAQCRTRIDVLQKDLETGIAERVKAVTETVMNENARRREENDSLNAEKERLQGEVQREQGKVTRLTAERDRLNAEIVGLKAEIDRLKAEVEQLQPPREAEPPKNL